MFNWLHIGGQQKKSAEHFLFSLRIANEHFTFNQHLSSQTNNKSPLRQCLNVGGPLENAVNAPGKLIF